MNSSRCRSRPAVTWRSRFSTRCEPASATCASRSARTVSASRANIVHGAIELAGEAAGRVLPRGLDRGVELQRRGLGEAARRLLVDRSSASTCRRSTSARRASMRCTTSASSRSIRSASSRSRGFSRSLSSWSARRRSAACARARRGAPAPTARRRAGAPRGASGRPRPGAVRASSIFSRSAWSRALGLADEDLLALGEPRELGGRAPAASARGLRSSPRAAAPPAAAPPRASAQLGAGTRSRSSDVPAPLLGDPPLLLRERARASRRAHARAGARARRRWRPSPRG